MNPQATVEKWLKAGKSISVQLCLKMCQTTELRVIIARLRKRMPIDDSWVTNKDKRFKVYRLGISPDCYKTAKR